MNISDCICDIKRENIILYKDYKYSDFCNKIDKEYLFNFFFEYRDLSKFDSNNKEIIFSYMEELSNSLKTNYKKLSSCKNSNFLNIQTLIIYFKELEHRFNNSILNNDCNVIYVPCFTKDESRQFKNFNFYFNVDKKGEMKDISKEYERIVGELSNCGYNLIDFTIRGLDNLLKKQYAS